ncbi:MAG: GTP cyclohydrolase II RibA [Bosea sp. (in: a-proteobacteria)]
MSAVRLVPGVALSGAQLLGRTGEADHIAADRAIAEFRAGRPVLIHRREEALLLYSAELADADMLDRLCKISDGRAHLVLPAARLRRLGLERDQPGVVALPTLDADRIISLALKVEGRIDAPVRPAQALDITALELAALAQVLPPVIALPVVSDAHALGALFSVEARVIDNYRAEQVRTIKMVGRAPVPLEGADSTEFVVFRGGEGLRDQVAIIIGNPDLSAPVPVRLHSACLTGDLFGSLKCDCGDQLRETVRWMAETDGGILLYLDQEGRGNGIANKMRAYKLQSEGWDTYDADELLGFDFDQRRFAFAGEMLRQLGVTKVTALTNNPEKIKALRVAGLDVVASQRVLGRPSAHNVRYLATKRDRAGHEIDMDAVMARKPSA